jgi:plasmid stabilization system protein ParE
MKPARYAAVAKVDLIEQVNWYESKQPGRGEHFRESVDIAVSRIMNNPTIGTPFGAEDKRRLFLSKPYTRFSLVYVEMPDSLLILAVWASERDPAELARR